MQSSFRIAAIVVASTFAFTLGASAQGVGSGGNVGPAGMIQSPATPPPSIAPRAGATTGMGGGVSQPGAPNATTPGRIGSGASPSGLAGDSPSAPGFPDKVGR